MTQQLAPLRAELAGAGGAGGARLVEAAGATGAEARGARGEARQYEALGRAAVRALHAALPPDALVLLLPPTLEYNHDFLNRVTILMFIFRQEGRRGRGKYFS